MPRQKIEKPKNQEIKTKSEKKPVFYQAVGRKKESTARVRLYVDDDVKLNDQILKKGEMYVNAKPVQKYFIGTYYEKLYLQPLETTGNLGRFGVSAKVSGGGLKGQLGAIILGISRALEEVDKEKYRPILKKHGLLTRDPREKERRKAGFAQKARAKKQSPKR
ncbi:30S ribosomal protein S9 [Candidatus Gottesmanbacteria bacterium]|nr:30S ribosomal protein S9 [Candidatus Gottesmanbacteria bacterium]